MNTYTLESFINFCDDMQIAEEKASTQAADIYFKNIRRIKKLWKEGKKLVKHKEYDSGIVKLEECKKEIIKLKSAVHNIPQEGNRDNLVVRIIMNLVTMFTVRTSEVTSISGNAITNTSYVDELSQYASDVKNDLTQANIQKAFNLIIKQCNTWIARAKLG